MSAPRHHLVGLLGPLLALASACETGSPAAPVIPDDHPCPAQALVPEEASLWVSERAGGAPVPLTLGPPLTGVGSALVSQGTQQPPTHEGTLAWAVDLAVPVGTDVVAAAPGVVVLVRDDSDRHGVGPEHLLDANWLVLDHGGGLYSSYVHLAVDSAAVAPGDVVEAGTLLARTGLSGQLAGPHLHFQVENVWSESLPARFAQVAGGCNLAPETGGALVIEGALWELLVGRQELSPLPGDTFEDLGVTWVEGPPARLARVGSKLALGGDAAPGVEDVWALVFPEAGGDAVAFSRMPVAHGGFQGQLDLSDLPPGRYGWVLVGTEPDEDPVAERSIRLTVY